MGGPPSDRCRGPLVVELYCLSLHHQVYKFDPFPSIMEELSTLDNLNSILLIHRPLTHTHTQTHTTPPPPTSNYSHFNNTLQNNIQRHQYLLRATSPLLNTTLKTKDLP